MPTLIDAILPHLEPFGFQQRDHRLLRLSHDLLEVIEVNPFSDPSAIQIRIGLIPICWEGLVYAHPLIGSKKLETIAPEFQPSQKKDGVDYLISFLTGPVLSYFERYNSTKKVLRHINDFEPEKLLPATDSYQFRLLILFCELRQEQPHFAHDFLDQYMATNLYQAKRNPKNKILQAHTQHKATEWIKLKSWLKESNWEDLQAYLDEKQAEILDKLSLH